MGKKDDLNVFECGVVLGTRQADLSISETADLLGISITTVFRSCRKSSEKEHIQPSAVLWMNVLLIQEENDQTSLS